MDEPGLSILFVIELLISKKYILPGKIIRLRFFRSPTYLCNNHIHCIQYDKRAMRRNSGRGLMSEELLYHAFYAWQFSCFLVFF